MELKLQNVHFSLAELAREIEPRSALVGEDLRVDVAGALPVGVGAAA